NIFFFSSRRRHTRFSRDWSSDVCSSDLKHVERLMSDLKLSQKPDLPSSLICENYEDLRILLLQVSDLKKTNDKLLHELKLGKLRSEERRVGKECMTQQTT